MKYTIIAFFAFFMLFSNAVPYARINILDPNAKTRVIGEAHFYEFEPELFDGWTAAPDGMNSQTKMELLIPTFLCSNERVICQDFWSLRRKSPNIQVHFRPPSLASNIIYAFQIGHITKQFQSTADLQWFMNNLLEYVHRTDIDNSNLASFADFIDQILYSFMANSDNLKEASAEVQAKFASMMDSFQQAKKE